MTDDAEERATVALDAAEAGGAVAHDLFREEIEVETKSNATDVVTRADREAQVAVVDRIRESYPDASVVGEEEGELDAVPASGPAWVVDPVDGTSNFTRGLRLWTTSVAAVEDGEPVAAANVCPALGDVYTHDATTASRNGRAVTVDDRSAHDSLTVVPAFWWGHDAREEYATICREIVERFGDMRRFGSLQASLSYLAAGAVDGVVTNRTPNPWDTIAGVGMVRRAGGRVTDRHGERWRHDSPGLVASNGAPAVHDALVETARATEQVRESR